MDPLSITVSVLALAKTVQKVTYTFQELVGQFRDAPSGITHLFSEHKLMSNCVERFKGLIEQNANSAEPEMRIQANSVISDTHRTLEELHSNIKGLILSKPNGKRSVLTIRCKYMWNEKPLQATLLRLQARRDAMSLLLNLWSSADAVRARTELAGIRRTLEDTLSDIRQQQQEDRRAANTSTTSLPEIPSTLPEADTLVADGQSISGTTVNDSEGPSSPESSDPAPVRPNVSNLRDLFEKSLIAGRQAGPAGTQIAPRIQRLNAERAADGRQRQQDLSPMIRDLAVKEAGAPSLSSEASATAAHALGKAYEVIEDYENALIYYHESLAAREFLLGTTHPSTLSTVESIAGVLQLQSQWGGALEYYLLLLGRRQENPKMKRDHPSILAVCLNIARMHGNMGEYDIAVEAFRNVLAVYAAMPSGGGTKAIQIRSEIAGFQSRMGDHAAALAEYESVSVDWKRVLASREEEPRFGPAHPLTEEARRAVGETGGIIQKTRLLLQQSSNTSRDDASPPPIKHESSIISTDSSMTASVEALPVRPSPVLKPSTDDSDIREYKKLLHEAQRFHGEVHPVTLDHMCNLAFAYASHDQHDTAIGWYKEAVRGWEKLHGPDHPNSLATKKAMAQSHAAKGDHGTALKHLDEVLRGREARLETDHPDTLDTLREMGGVHASLQEFGPAVSLLKKAEAGFLAKYGPNHEDTLQTQFNLAEVYLLKGQLAQSLGMHEYVLTTRQACLGDKHQWTLSSKHAVAAVCEKLGQHDRAVLLFTEAAEGRGELLGKKHSVTQNSVLELASVLWNTGRYGTALTYYQWALESVQHESPDKPGAGVITMANIAGCFLVLDRHEEALEWYRKTHAILEALYGREHPRTIKALQSVAESCKNTERWAEAVELLAQALEATERLLPENTRGIQSMLFDLGWCNFKLNQFEASLTWSRRLCSDPDVPAERVLVTRRRMGVILTHQGRLEEAIETLLDVLEQASAHLPSGHWVVCRAMEGLEEAYSLSAKRQVSLQNLQRQRELVMARLDSSEPATIGMLAGLADVHLEQNLFHEAVPMLESTLKAIEEARVDDGARLDVSTLKELDIVKSNTLVALSTAHQSLGNYAAAIRYLEQRAEGERGPGIRLDALSRIAWLHSKNGDCQQSLTTYLQLLSEQLELGPELAIPANKTRRLVGTLHKQLGDANEALSWYQTALEGFESLSGGRNGKDKAVSAAATTEAMMDPSSQAVVEALVTTNLMSTLYSALGQLDMALEYRLRAAEGFERELGADAELTLGAALALAKMYKVRERKVEADVWFLKALRGYEAKLEDGVDGVDSSGGEVSTVREQIAQLKRELRHR